MIAYKYLIVKDKSNLINALKNKKIKENVVKVKNNIVFMFSGQGSQYINMGKELYDSNPIFKRHIDNGLNILQELNGIDYKKILFSLEDKGANQINTTFYTQPILFAFEYALAQFLLEIGVAPTYMIGHSLGEYVAATISNVFSLEDALKIIKVRSTEMANTGKTTPGTMAAILGAKDDQLEIICNQDGIVVPANINAPEQIVISGEINAIKNKMHIFVEKPFSHNLDGFESFKEIILHKQLYFYVSFQRRFHPYLMEISEIISGLTSSGKLIVDDILWSTYF